MQGDSGSPGFVQATGLPDHICALTTTRAGGCSTGPFSSFNLGMHVGDDPSHVQHNRLLLRARLPGDPHWLEQVHGTEVFDADCSEGAPAVPQADAAITTVPGKVLAVMTADCLPVVICSQTKPMLAVAHAGWRGLADGVLQATIQALQGKSAQPADLVAWIGPAIGPDAFQVGDDVRKRFLALDYKMRCHFRVDPSASQKWLADLPALARHLLLASGVSHVHLSGLCTVTDAQKRFFSYRRDSVTGRMATLAWIKL